MKFVTHLIPDTQLRRYFGGGAAFDMDAGEEVRMPAGAKLVMSAQQYDQFNTCCGSKYSTRIVWEVSE